VVVPEPYFFAAPIAPEKRDPELVVHTNRPATPYKVQPVARRNA